MRWVRAFCSADNLQLRTGGGASHRRLGFFLLALQGLDQRAVAQHDGKATGRDCNWETPTRRDPRWEEAPNRSTVLDLRKLPCGSDRFLINPPTMFLSSAPFLKTEPMNASRKCSKKQPRELDTHRHSLGSLQKPCSSWHPGAQMAVEKREKKTSHHKYIDECQSSGSLSNRALPGFFFHFFFNRRRRPRPRNSPVLPLGRSDGRSVREKSLSVSAPKKRPRRRRRRRSAAPTSR